MTLCKEGSQREGLMLDSTEKLYKWFTQKVGRACCTCSRKFSTALMQYVNIKKFKGTL